MNNVEIRKASRLRDDNLHNDTCIECGAKHVRAYLTTTIVKVPLCPGCLKRFAAEARQCVDDDPRVLKPEASVVTTEKSRELEELKAENGSLRKAVSGWHDKYCNLQEKIDALECKLACVTADKWLMTAEWAEAMGLASCNIAAKFMSRENFEVGDDYRSKTIKKYRHRQVVFYKYADYCRRKA